MVNFTSFILETWNLIFYIYYENEWSFGWVLTPLVWIMWMFLIFLKLGRKTRSFERWKPFSLFSIFMPKVYIILSFGIEITCHDLNKNWPSSSFSTLFQWCSEKSSFNSTWLVTLRVGSKKIFFFLTLVEYIDNHDCTCFKWSRGRRKGLIWLSLCSCFALTFGECQVHVRC